MKIPMGVYDSPQTQEQPILYLSPYRSNIAVFGGPMSGKTTFVKTLLVRLHQVPNPAIEEHVYIIDFGGNLGPYSRLPRVCACFDNSNEENIKRVFKALERRLAENARQLGSSSFLTMAQEHPEACPPHLMLIIENLSSFLADERYSAYQDRLLHLCRDGLSKGLCVVVTANDTAGTGRLMANFGQKVAFEMPADNYMEIFNTAAAKPMRLPGRGLVNLDSEVYEFQCFVPFARDNAPELQQLLEQPVSIRPEDRLLRFDSELTPENLAASACGPIRGLQHGRQILVGLDYYEHKPVEVDIGQSRCVAIYGKRQFGKTNLLRRLLTGVRLLRPEARFVFLDDGRKQLLPFTQQRDGMFANHVYLTGVDAFRDYLTENGYGGKRSLRATKKQVPPLPVESPISPDTPFTVFVLQSKSLYQSSVDATYLMRDWIPEMIGNAEARDYLFLFTDVRSFSAPEVRDPFNHSVSVAFLLDNIGEFVNDKGNKSVFGEMDARELKAEYAKCTVGDGYCYDVEADELTKLKLIKCQ